MCTISASSPHSKWHIIVALTVLVLAMLILPLVGTLLSGGEMDRFLCFPFRSERTAPLPFSWPVFALAAVVTAVVLAPFAWHVMRKPLPRATEGPVKSLPAWAAFAGLLGVAAWSLAWTRLPRFSHLQPYTYPPVWLCFIVLLNGLSYRRTGRCLLTHRTGYFATLFASSAVFWWLFEYLNQFSCNWVYPHSEDLSTTGQLLLGTLSFATVLPGVMSMAECLQAHGARFSSLASFQRMPWVCSRWSSAFATAVASVCLFAIGIWPNYLFPVLWVAPLLLFAGIQGLLGSPHILSPLASGNWQRVCLWSVAALLCGLCWEMWNMHSLLKWVYTVPWVGRVKVFEMPILGYAGYLPFGLECGMIADAVHHLMARGSQPPLSQPSSRQTHRRKASVCASN